MTAPTIIEAIDDPELFGPWFKKPESWRRWRVFLKSAFCLGLDADERLILTEHTDLDAPPAERPRELWVKGGRRSGKSLIISTIAAYLAAFENFAQHLVPGEDGVILIVAVDRKGAQVCMRYLSEMFTRIPALAAMLDGPPTSDTITLRTGIVIEIGTNNHRSIRGRTIVAALCDEVAHWRSEEHFANPAGEVIDGAIRPAMGTIPNAMLLAISSPFKRSGIQWTTFKECYGKPGDTLCWIGRSLVMNPTTLDPRLVERAYRKDAAKAAQEFDCQEREDLEDFISAEAVERCVAAGRLELPPRPGVRFFGFVDAAGGSGGDSMTAAISFVEPARDGRARVVVAAVRECRPKFSPDDVTAEFAAFFKSYGIRQIKGDRYAGDFPVDRFKAHNITLHASDMTKSELYLELAPEINAGTVDLLDHPRTNEQLCALVRTPGRNNRDAVDHPKGAGWHDDLINAVAGAVVEARREGRVSITPEFTAACARIFADNAAAARAGGRSLISVETRRSFDQPSWRRGG
jgi:hypothetical protein